MENQQQKFIETTYQATYSTLNQRSANTTDIWLVCHGYGQLAKYFIRRFDVLDPEKNFVIAPQGLSYLYLSENYDRVGASWLTKEDREHGIANQLTYLKNVFETETAGVDWPNVRLNLMGFSQGVAAVARFAAHVHPKFYRLVLWAGTIPQEIGYEQFKKFSPSASIHFVIGRQDRFYNAAVIQQQANRLTEHYKTPTIFEFDGGHEVSREVLKTIVED